MSIDIFFKTILSEFSNDNVNVFMVDGSNIRDPLTEPFDMDFTEGDNDAHNPTLVPAGEVWIDLDVAPTEVRCTILHELTERRYMINDSMDYGKAHDLANVAEQFARSHRDQLNELCLAELKIAPYYKKTPEAKSMKTQTVIKKSLPVTIRKTTNGQEEIVINSGLPDRGGDRVFAEGGDCTDWYKNPVVMWLHDYRGSTPSAGIPLGTGTSIKAVNGELIAGAINWLENDPFVDRVRNAWNQNVLRTVSIGFEPPEDPRDMPANDFGGVDYKKWKLLEFSIVPIPMDADALRRKEYPELVDDHKPSVISQAEIKDELDYNLTIIKLWDLNEENQTIAKSIYEELKRRFAGSDISDNIISIKLNGEEITKSDNQLLHSLFVK
jgi:hypothetical protein